MFTEGISTSSSSNVVIAAYDKQLLKRLGNRVYFSKLGDPMAYGEVCEAKMESPLQSELNSLRYEIRNTQQQIKLSQERLRIARAKLAAVKALVK